jgi:hypothetical protein
MNDAYHSESDSMDFRDNIGLGVTNLEFVCGERNKHNE